MTNDPMLNMWISFIGMGLMFVSVALTIFTKEKLHGFLRYLFLSISFICLVAAGIIVFFTVFAGPTPE